MKLCILKICRCLIHTEIALKSEQMGRLASSYVLTILSLWLFIECPSAHWNPYKHIHLDFNWRDRLARFEWVSMDMLQDAGFKKISPRNLYFYSELLSPSPGYSNHTTCRTFAILWDGPVPDQGDRNCWCCCNKVRAKGVGGGEGRFESKGEGRLVSSKGPEWMEIHCQISGFFFYLLAQGVIPRVQYTHKFGAGR